MVQKNGMKIRIKCGSRKKVDSYIIWDFDKKVIGRHDSLHFYKHEKIILKFKNFASRNNSLLPS